MKSLSRPLLLQAMMCLVVLCTVAEQQHSADQWLVRPVDTKTFKRYLDLYVYDSHIPFESRILDVEELQKVRKEHLWFQSTPGVRVSANLYRTDTSPSYSQKRPTAILLHGGAEAQGKDSISNTILAETLADAGWDVLAIDLQYFGQRRTDLLTTFSDNERHERLYNSPSTYLAWVIQTLRDVSRGFDFLVEQKNADPKRVFLIGFGRGAIIGSIVGAVERRLAAVVLLYGGHFDAMEREHLAAACPANYIGHISPRPLLMVNGTDDSDMSRERSVQPLFRLARPPKKILWAKTGHQLPTREQREAMLQWLRENVK